MRAVLKAAIWLIVAGAVTVAVVFLFVGSRGITARAEPGALETTLARGMRRLAIPRAGRNLKNPVAATPEVLAAGMSHYADHCAVCHANDGSGQTAMGRGLYPKPPDMRSSRTQSLTDGEIFYIIENGVRLTGMPAWGDGTAEGTAASWHLVHFIRKLPTLTAEEIERMEAMNPRNPADVLEEEEARRFLAGEGTAPAPAPKPKPAHGGHK